MKKVIKFYANWCGPCKVYAPVFTKVRQELESQEIQFEEINVEDPVYQSITKQYKITGIPATVVENNGQSTLKAGRLNEQQLKQFILGE